MSEVLNCCQMSEGGCWPRSLLKGGRAQAGRITGKHENQGDAVPALQYLTVVLSLQEMTLFFPVRSSSPS